MTDLMAGEIIAIAVLVLGVLYLVGRLVRGTEVPDAGVQVFLLDDCDDDYGCPMVIDEDPGNGVAYYGTRLVHRLCIEARRDGGAVCTTCATVMDGVRAA